uniref:60S ribosomal export protein NMD3 n=1 Tax=Monodelphis domestica TaxID=13616 RepID=F7E4H4_MONDO
MEYMKGPAVSSQGCVLCCECGVPIPPNPANMCVACLRTQVDISEGIPKQVSIHFCKQCERYLQPPGTWIQCALESRELLTLCLKKIKASLSKVRLIEAGFVWTEPHSKRLKVKLTIQKEVMNGAILQQVFVVEYVVHSQMCDACHRVEAKDFWKAVVQVRQKTLHKKTFYYLEQLILKHRAHQNTLRIKEIHDGLDFYYAQKQHAQKMVDFLQCTVPSRSKSSQRLISHDVHSNTYNYKSTFSVEIVPICKDNVVCLPPRLAQSLGNMSQICVCIRVTSAVHLIDPSTLQSESEAGRGRGALRAWGPPRRETRFLRTSFPVWGAALGFTAPAVSAQNGWLSYSVQISFSRQYQDFLEDLEEDEAIRKNVNIYKASTIPVESDTDDEGAPRISLAEMLEDLHIAEDATGGEGAAMMA